MTSKTIALKQPTKDRLDKLMADYIGQTGEVNITRDQFINEIIDICNNCECWRKKDE